MDEKRGLKDHEIQELINDVRDELKVYINLQCLRELIAKPVLKYLETKDLRIDMPKKPEEVKERPGRCPYCYALGHAKQVNTNAWYVYCSRDLTCRFATPVMASEEAAIRKWNSVSSLLKGEKP